MFGTNLDISKSVNNGESWKKLSNNIKYEDYCPHIIFNGPDIVNVIGDHTTRSFDKGANWTTPGSFGYHRAEFQGVTQIQTECLIKDDRENLYFLRIDYDGTSVDLAKSL